MATLMDGPTTLDATISFPIVKMEETPDGDLIVYGKATDGSVDSDDQIVDADWSGKALTEWLKTGGNVRVQHSPQLYPAGKGIEVDVDKDGAHWVKALVVEDTAKNLVRKGVLQAYSVGIARPQLVRDAKARGGRIVGGQIAELSLVDRPANKNCGITLVKSGASGEVEVINKMWGTAPLENGASVATDVIEKSEDGDTVTATVTFTPKDLAKILGKGKATDEPRAEDMDTDESSDDTVDKGKVPEQFLEHVKKPKDGENGDEPDDAEPDDVEPDDDDKADKDATGTGPFMTTATPSAATAPSGSVAVAGKADKPTGFDPSVGGGVHRSEIDAKDFAGKDRSFPIVTPGDVSDAASSIGRAGADNYSSDKLKSNIIRIARRKGASFVAELPEAWKKELGMGKAEKAAKAPKKACPDCGKKARGKFCPECGAKMIVSDVAKGHGPTPVSDAKPKAKDMKPVPEHREPDGPQMEALEDDAGMQGEPNEVHESSGTGVPGSDWDGTTPRLSSSEGTSLKSASYEVKRLHDLTCAAYSGKSVNQHYPALSSIADAISVDEWRQKAMEAVSASDMDYAALTLELAKAADYLSNASVSEISEAHEDLHKSFTDMYPNVSLTPMEVDPGRYQRPYLTAGHQRASFDQKPDGLKKPVAREIDASQFQRGPITSGHERPSPANSGNNAGAGGGASAALYNANAMRNQAANSMKNLHDHISDTYPQLCPLATGNPAPAEGHGVKKSEKPEITKTEAAESEHTERLDAAEFLAKAATTGTPVTADLIKSAMTEVLAERDDQIRALQTRLAELEELPNPYESAYRGLGITKSFNTPSGVPEEAISAIEKAARQKDEALYGYLQNRSVYAPSPAEREEARVAMQQMQQ